jgi:hypothetical protein
MNFDSTYSDFRFQYRLGMMMEIAAFITGNILELIAQHCLTLVI